MHKLLLLASLLLVSLGIFTITNLDSRATNTPPIEMVAFSSLSDKEQELILTSPKDSTVKQVSVSDELRIVEKTYDSNQVYAVTFNNTAIHPSGNLVVYVALDEKTVVGKGFSGNISQ